MGGRESINPLSMFNKKIVIFFIVIPSSDELLIVFELG
jgi:hypothetical protein